MKDKTLNIVLSCVLFGKPFRNKPLHLVSKAYNHHSFFVVAWQLRWSGNCKLDSFYIKYTLMCRVLYSSFSTDVFCYVSLVYCTRYISLWALEWKRTKFYVVFAFPFFWGGGEVGLAGSCRETHRLWLHRVSPYTNTPLPASNFNELIQK
jgi:hypothetical protein